MNTIIKKSNENFCKPDEISSTFKIFLFFKKEQLKKDIVKFSLKSAKDNI